MKELRPAEKGEVSCPRQVGRNRFSGEPPGGSNAATEKAFREPTAPDKGPNRHEQRRGVRSEQRQAAADRSDAGLALSSAVHLRRAARAGRPGLAGRHSCPSVSVQAGTGRLFCAPVWRRPAVRTRVNGFGSPRRMAHSAAATHGHPPGRRRCRAQTKAHTPLPSRGRIPGAAPPGPGGRASCQSSGGRTGSAQTFHK